MARLTELEDHLSQKDEAKKRRSLHYHRSPWPCHLPIKTSNQPPGEFTTYFMRLCCVPTEKIIHTEPPPELL